MWSVHIYQKLSCSYLSEGGNFGYCFSTAGNSVGIRWNFCCWYVYSARANLGKVASACKAENSVEGLSTGEQAGWVEVAHQCGQTWPNHKNEVLSETWDLGPRVYMQYWVWEVDVRWQPEGEANMRVEEGPRARWLRRVVSVWTWSRSGG